MKLKAKLSLLTSILIVFIVIWISGFLFIFEKRFLIKESKTQREHISQGMAEVVKEYFINKPKGFVFPDSLKIDSIKKTYFKFGQKSNSFQNKVLKLPELYYYKGNYPRRENTFNNRYKIKFNKPFTYDEFENKHIKIAIIFPK